MTRGRVVLSGLLLATMVSPAAAQFQARRYQVGARLGTVSFDKTSGIKDGPMLGVDGTYFFTSNIGVGFMLDVTRPETDGRFFPAEFTFLDTTFVYEVTQPLTVLQVGGQGVLRLPVGDRIAPYVLGGFGWYRFYLDPQVSYGPRAFTNTMTQVGAGLTIRMGENSGIRFEFRNIRMQDYDRERLNPVGPRFRPVRFPELVVAPEAPKNTASNSLLSIAFSFTPGGQ